MKRLSPLIKLYSRIMLVGLCFGVIAQPIFAQTHQKTVMVKGDQFAIAANPQNNLEPKAIAILKAISDLLRSAFGNAIILLSEL